MAARFISGPVPPLRGSRGSPPPCGARPGAPARRRDRPSWLEEIEWDFRKSAELVRRFVDHARAERLCPAGRRRGGRVRLLRAGGGKGAGGRSLRAAGPAHGGAREPAARRGARSHDWRTRPSTGWNRSSSCCFAPARPVPFAPHAVYSSATSCASTSANAALAEGRVRRPMYMEKWSDLYQEPPRT